MQVKTQGSLILLALLCASPLVAATVAPPPPPTPETVPLLDTWALVGLGVVLAIAGGIASLRVRKKK